MRRSMLVTRSSPCTGAFSTSTFWITWPRPSCDHALRAVDAGERAVVGELEPLEPRLVEVGEAEQVSGDLAVRVEALVFALEVDAGNPELADLAPPRPGSRWRAT